MGVLCSHVLGQNGTLRQSQHPPFFKKSITKLISMEHSNQKKMSSSEMSKKHYIKLLIMLAISFVAMYLLMYAMVNSISNVIFNINQFYMAGLMIAAMAIIEISLMRAMYMNKKFNTIIIGVSSLILISFFFFIQQQSAVSDKQFLKSMIPHHASAILMSEKSETKDPEIKKLQMEIISSQQAEIKVMKAKLEELEK